MNSSSSHDLVRVPEKLLQSQKQATMYSSFLFLLARLFSQHRDRDLFHIQHTLPGKYLSSIFYFAGGELECIRGTYTQGIWIYLLSQNKNEAFLWGKRGEEEFFFIFILQA